MNNGTLVALDLFAGTGWGLACRWLGIAENGVELMKEAQESRALNGMSTIYADVWDGLSGVEHYPSYDILIASPPCQTFSVAGGGAGRRALDEVLLMIQEFAYDLPGDGLLTRARELGLDDRTALVLAPLAHIWRDTPEYVVLEQVPTVLPVWEAYAEVMIGMGYFVWTGILNAEQYGVPQTRKRAILMARYDKPIGPPVPTHSRYYPRDPARLDEGVEKWVSMAEALGWSEPSLVGFPRKSDGQAEVVLDGVAYRARDLRDSEEPSQVVTSKARSWKRIPKEAEEWGDVNKPAPTVAGDSRLPKRGYRDHTQRQMDGALKLTVEQAAALQSYPSWGFTDRPAPTQTGHGLATRQASGQQAIYQEAIASGEFEFKPPFDEASARISDDKISLSRAFVGESVNMETHEAGVVQSYPREFTFAGSKTNQFLQIGNAVPPLLARRILEAVLS